MIMSIRRYLVLALAVVILIFGYEVETRAQSTASESEKNSCPRAPKEESEKNTCEALSKKFPNDPDLYLNIGNYYNLKNDRVAARNWYKKGIEASPNYYRSYLVIGILAGWDGNIDQAIDADSAVIKLRPSDPFAYKNRGASWLEKKDYDKSIADFDEAIKLDPKFSEAYRGRSRAWTEKREYDKAISDLNEVLKLDPKNFEAYRVRCDRKVDKGSYKEALDDCNEAINLNPKFSEAYVSRGNIWGKLKDSAKAVADYNMCIKIDPKCVNGIHNRANLWLDKKDFIKAISDFDQVIKLDPKYATGYHGRGLAMFSKGNYDAALADFNKSIELNPKISVAFNNRGNTWARKGDVLRAIADYSEAIKLDPKDSVFYHNRGLILISSGDYDKAIADFSNAISLDSKFVTAYVGRGNVFSAKGDYEKAVTDYSQAIKLDPTNAMAKENLKLALLKKQRVEKRSTEQRAEPVSHSDQTTKSDGRRVALIIGNSRYLNVPALDNPARDAELLANALGNIGFDDVNLKLNLTRDQMMTALNEFQTIASGADWAVIYFAGHGIEVEGINYMLPVDAKLLEESSISTQTVNMGYFLNAAEEGHKLRLVIIDACRNNPFAQQVHNTSSSRGIEGSASTSVGHGLARVEPDPGTLVVYAAKNGEFALDGDGKNSPFVEALAKRISQTPPIEVRRLFDFVREDVVNATKKEQQPFAYGSLSAADDFYFKPK